MLCIIIICIFYILSDESQEVIINEVFDLYEHGIRRRETHFWALKINTKFHFRKLKKRINTKTSYEPPQFIKIKKEKTL